ncbi:LPXTG cell wall anchor domain-containing protein [Streptococcus salivarius]|jgi:LPXTG-motif cell wall-anchored protein|uniref:LPXTG cell wall anchor domain-containing protein n=1 Tax=Streptococcus salivarius TaxID=1304 RepID=UPI0039C40BC3
MISQTIAKPSFTKSKAYGLCGTLALATALLIGAGSVSAEEPTKPTPEKPVTPKEVPNKPADAPKDKAAQSTTVSYKLDSEPKEVANTTVYGGVLPNTGEKEGIMSTLGLAVIAVGIAGLTLSFKKYNERGEN